AIGLACCDEALALSPIPFDAMMTHAVRAYGLVKGGKVHEGIGQLQEVIGSLSRSNLPYTRTMVAYFLADSYLRLGRREAAREPPPRRPRRRLRRPAHQPVTNRCRRTSAAPNAVP